MIINGNENSDGDGNNHIPIGIVKAKPPKRNLSLPLTSLYNKKIRNSANSQTSSHDRQVNESSDRWRSSSSGHTGAASMLGHASESQQQ